MGKRERKNPDLVINNNLIATDLPAGFTDQHYTSSPRMTRVLIYEACRQAGLWRLLLNEIRF
jgi:hypothetical protein